MLVVDQLEELFTLAQESERGREERAAFFTALRAVTLPAVCGGAPVVMLVAAVRGDFLDQALRFPLLAEAVDAEVFAITPMNEGELRAAVTGPAAEAGIVVEEAVVDAVVAEVRSKDPAVEGFGVGVLPLVSQAMYAAWEHREPGGGLDLRAYRRGGGSTDAVNRSAQALYDGLSLEGQSIAGSVFTLLTVVFPDGRLARRRLAIGQLHAACAADRAEVDAVISAFAARRLLVTDGSGVEIAHDVLLTSWHQLTVWLEGDRLDRSLHSRLLGDTALWLDHGRNGGYLYSADQLAEARTAVDRWKADTERYPQPTSDATEFLQAAHRTARRGTYLRHAGIVSLVMVTAIATVFAVFAYRNAADASRQHAVALSRQLAAESLSIKATDPVTARRLAAAAWHASPTKQADDVMVQLLTEQQRNGMLPASTDPVYGVAFSPDGSLLATGNDDGTVRLWNPVTRKPVGGPLPSGGAGPVHEVAFSPVGSLLAAAHEDGTVRLWNPVTRKPVGGPLPSSGAGPVLGVAFSRDGSLLATGNDDGTVRLWNPGTRKPVGDPLPSGGAGPVVGVAFSRDGSLLATAHDDGTVRLWNPGTRKPVGDPLPSGGAGPVVGVAFSRDGSLLATGNDDGTVRLWNPGTRKPVGDPLPSGGAGPV
ncbi:WD40 repeat domain-containing protein, partial [Streptomyces sp. 8L]